MEGEGTEEYVRISRLAEQIDPFLRTVVFCKLLQPGTHSLPPKVQMRIVQQHIAYMGLDKTLATLEEESKTTYVDPGLDESVLIRMLRGTMRAVDEVYDLFMSGRAAGSGETEEGGTERMPELDECLFRMGLLQVEDKDDVTTSVWSEKAEGAIMAPDGSLKAASVNQLILKLTSETESDVAFLKTFLMTYQSFIKPARLLAKLMERFEIPPNLAFNAVDAVKIKSRCVNVLKQWLNMFPDDFSDAMIEVLNRFVAKMGAGALAESLRQPLARRSKKNELEAGSAGVSSVAVMGSGYASPTTVMPEPRVDLKTIFLPDFSLNMLESEELARQLTLMFHQVFVCIRPSEMLDAAWTRPNKHVVAPNVCKFISLFNHMSYLVAHSIVNPATTRARAAQYRFWVKTAQHLLRLNNFTGLMAVLAAFNVSAVFRLKNTVKEVSPVVRQSLTDMERIMSSTSSFKAYRDLIATCVPPAVPYVGLLLQDLTFIETNPNKVEGGVSWSKRTKIYESIENVMRFQGTSYALMSVPQIQHYLQSQPFFSEAELFALSQVREPRVAQAVN